MGCEGHEGEAQRLAGSRVLLETQLKRIQVMSNTTRSKSARQDADRLLIGGIKKHFGAVTSVMVNGVSYAPAQIVVMLQQEIDASDAVGPAHAAWIATIAAQKAVTNSLKAVKSALRSFVLNLFGKGSPALADFGYTKAPQKPSPATQVKAAELRNATRKARGTLGKSKKKAIKGTLPATPPSATSGSGPTPKA